MTKEKSCLITTSLVGAIDWYLSAPDVVIKSSRGGDGKTTWKEKAEKDLHNQLSRVYGEMSEEAKWGIEFEKQVYKHANSLEKIPETFSPEFKRVCREVNGFMFGQKSGKNVKIAGENCYLYAKYDAIKFPMVKDIKSVTKYEFGKFANKFQHKLYCYISNAEDFEYIIVEWDEFPKIKDVYKERYPVDSREALEKEVLATVEETLVTIKDLCLWDLYKDKFCLY